MALGWWVRDDLAEGRCGSHLGQTGVGFFPCPEEDFAVVFLSNLSGGYGFLGDEGLPAGLVHEIAERAAEEYLVAGAGRRPQ